MLEIANELDNLNLRSEPSTTEVYVRFINRTNRQINVIWINFNGELVTYKTLSHHQFFDVNTFTEHPWIFVDADTNDRMYAQGRKVFYAVPAVCPNTQRVARRCVAIHIPVYTLKTCALQAIRTYLKEDAIIDELDIPLVLKDDIKYVIDAYKRFQNFVAQ